MNKKSGLSDSPFFRPVTPASKKHDVAASQVFPPDKQTPGENKQTDNHPPNDDTVIPRHHDTTLPRPRDAMTPLPSAMVETIRKAVKAIGKEAATHRFTVREKQLIADIIYHFSRQGIRTSENEIARIAINIIITDFEQRREQGLLGQVLRELNA